MDAFTRHPRNPGRLPGERGARLPLIPFSPFNRGRPFSPPFFFFSNSFFFSRRRTFLSALSGGPLKFRSSRLTSFFFSSLFSSSSSFSPLPIASPRARLTPQLFSRIDSESRAGARKSVFIREGEGDQGEWKEGGYMERGGRRKDRFARCAKLKPNYFQSTPISAPSFSRAPLRWGPPLPPRPSAYRKSNSIRVLDDHSRSVRLTRHLIAGHTERPPG